MNESSYSGRHCCVLLDATAFFKNLIRKELQSRFAYKLQMES